MGVILDLVGIGGSGPRAIGGSFARVVAGSREAERVHPDSGPWILERREGETFRHIGVYGSFTAAMEALDEQVGLGHGTLLDYEVELVEKKGASTRKLLMKVVWWVPVFVLSLIIASFAQATVNIVAVAIALGATALAGVGAWGVQRYTFLRRAPIVVLIAAVVVLVGLEPMLTRGQSMQREADIYAAIIEHFQRYGDPWIVARVCEDTAEPESCTPMSGQLKTALQDRLQRVHFVSGLEGVPAALFPDPKVSGGPGDATVWRFSPIEGSGDRVEVYSSYYCGSPCGAGLVNTVERRNGGWVVTDSQIVWVS